MDDQDRYDALTPILNSQQRWKAAKDKGVFDAEMASIEIETRKGTHVLDTDEHPRPDVTLEKLARLKPVFKKDGVVTAANASGMFYVFASSYSSFGTNN